MGETPGQEALEARPEAMLPFLAAELRRRREAADAGTAAIAAAAGVAEKVVVEFEAARRWPRGGPDRVVNAYADACGLDSRVIWGAAIAGARAAERS